MPFTFSHPAIVLPLAYLPKKWISLTGLIVGSLTPDFEYFLRMNVKSDYSHTWFGLFGFDLPLGLILAYVFHNIVRNSLINNLPKFFRRRFAAFKQFEWNGHFGQYWVVVTTSILIGVLSHIVWDSFTHSGGFAVNQISVLREHVILAGIGIPIYKLLQHLSTILGGAVILFAIYKLPVNDVARQLANGKYWIIVICTTIAVVVVRLVTGLAIVQIGAVVATVISGVLFSVI